MERLNLKAARANANMKQWELAKKLGVSQKTLSLWENGHTKVSKRTLMAICSVLGIREEDIFLPEDFTKRTH